MAQRVETNPLDAIYAALLSQGLDGAGEALLVSTPWGIARDGMNGAP